MNRTRWVGHDKNEGKCCGNGHGNASPDSRNHQELGYVGDERSD